MIDYLITVACLHMISYDTTMCMLIICHAALFEVFW